MRNLVRETIAYFLAQQEAINNSKQNKRHGTGASPLTVWATILRLGNELTRSSRTIRNYFTIETLATSKRRIMKRILRRRQSVIDNRRGIFDCQAH
jgi:hypothetical protein